MRSFRSKMLRFTLACLMLCAIHATGCTGAARFFGSNFSLNLIVPTGFGGNPGFYNPFGLTQALVNALIGGGGGAAAPNTVPTANVVGAITN